MVDTRQPAFPLRLSSVGNWLVRLFGFDPALFPEGHGTSGTIDTNLKEKTHIGPAPIRTEVGLDEE